jgi:hypothetical protein
LERAREQQQYPIPQIVYFVLTKGASALPVLYEYWSMETNFGELSFITETRCDNFCIDRKSPMAITDDIVASANTGVCNFSNGRPGRRPTGFRPGKGFPLPAAPSVMRAVLPAGSAAGRHPWRGVRLLFPA